MELLQIFLISLPVFLSGLFLGLCFWLKPQCVLKKTDGNDKKVDETLAISISLACGFLLSFIIIVILYICKKKEISNEGVVNGNIDKSSVNPVIPKVQFPVTSGVAV